MLRESLRVQTPSKLLFEKLTILPITENIENSNILLFNMYHIII